MSGEASETEQHEVVEEPATDSKQDAPPPETIRSLVRPAFAEFLASAIFVFVGCGCGVNAASSFKTPGPAVIAIALAFGVTIFVLAFMIGHISGGHINPVVSISFVLLGKITPMRGTLLCLVTLSSLCSLPGIMYFLAQFSGMILGVAFLRGCTPSTNFATGCFAANFVHAGMNSGEAFLSEIILTFFLMMTICAATDQNKSNQTLVPLAIGLCITCCHLMSLPITGTSLNPTRSFASAAIASNVPGCGYVWNSHWVFWFGPFLGGILGSVLYDYVFHDGGHKIEELIGIYRAKPGQSPH